MDDVVTAVAQAEEKCHHHGVALPLLTQHFSQSRPLDIQS